MSDLRYLLEKANRELDTTEKSLEKSEDGTVADLGIVPTGHSDGKREPYHSLDIHDDEDEDDGW